MSLIGKLRIALTPDPAKRVASIAVLGKDYLDSGKPRASLKMFRKGFEESERLPPSREVTVLRGYLATHVGWVMGLLQRYVDADRWCRCALDIDPAFAKAHELKARLLTAAQDFDGAQVCMS